MIKNLSKKILIGVILFGTNYVVSANDFFYKSKQNNEIMTRYNQVVTNQVLIDNIKLIKKDKEHNSVIFKGLQNKSNPNIKYNGEIEVIDREGEYKKDLSIRIKDVEGKKNLQLNVSTNNEDSIVGKILSSDKGVFADYLKTSKFNLNLTNSNNSSFIFELLDISGKKALFEKLSMAKSNQLKENLSVKSTLNENGEVIYKMSLENIFELNIFGEFKLDGEYIVFKDVKIALNMLHDFDELNEFGSIFNIEMNKGLNKKEIKEISIKF